MTFDINHYIDKALTSLRAKPLSGGLEIADSALRFAHFDGREWQMLSLRLPPNVIRGNEILDYKQLVKALSELRKQIFKSVTSNNQKISAVVSLAPANVYSQVFNLPMIGEKRLDEAVRLNIQMVSPIEFSKVYSGWQLVGRDDEQSQLEVLGAFVSRELIDNIKKALAEADFLVRAIEFRPISLARLVREEGVGVDTERSYVVLTLDNESLDFLILRAGRLYFEYYNSWRDLRGEEREISLSDFRSIIVRNFRQVLNYYAQHWQEPLSGILIVASGLGDELRKIIKDNFSLDAEDLKIKLDRPTSGEWFVALGSALRARILRRDDQDVNLLGSTTQDEYRKEQIVSFVNFWRIVVPAALILLAAGMLISDIVLMRMDQDLEAQLLNVGSDKITQFNELQRAADEFNHLVSLVQGARPPGEGKIGALDVIYEVASRGGVTISQFNFSDSEARIILIGKAVNRDNVLRLKNILEDDSRFQDIDFPLTAITESPQGVSFTISFVLASLKTD